MGEDVLDRNFKNNRMKNSNRQIILVMAFFIGGFAQTLSAQSTYSISNSKASDMKLSGTSSMHAWDMNASTFTSEAIFDFKNGDDQQLTGINSLNFSLPVSNLKSDKNALDKNAWKALKTNQHKNIDYHLISAKVSPAKDKQVLLKTSGNLTIAGVTREVQMDVYCIVNKDATITCSGSEKLNMTDYNVKPPSFMFGAMTTGDAVTLDFNVVYKNM